MRLLQLIGHHSFALVNVKCTLSDHMVSTVVRDA